MKLSYDYLAVKVPFRVARVVDGLGAELLRSDRDDCVRIGLSHAEHADVHFHQVFRFDRANSQHTLSKISK